MDFVCASSHGFSQRALLVVVAVDLSNRIECFKFKTRKFRHKRHSDALQISPKTGWKPTTLYHLRVCEFGRISCGSSHELGSYMFSDGFCLQFGYDQGYVTSWPPWYTTTKNPTWTRSVMSGIITGPHFISFFKSPNAVEIGSIVAVLEIGAFSKCLDQRMIPNLTHPTWKLRP